MGRKDLILLGAVVLIGAAFQLLFVAADRKDTPGRAVTAFTKAYYALDQAMVKRLCADRQSANDADTMAEYLDAVDRQASELGFRRSYMRMQVLDIRTETISHDDTSAQVRVTTTLKRCIHPAFTLVARIFRIGKTYAVEDVVTVVREDNAWKVCGKIFDLPGNPAG